MRGAGGRREIEEEEKAEKVRRKEGGTWRERLGCEMQGEKKEREETVNRRPVIWGPRKATPPPPHSLPE